MSLGELRSWAEGERWLGGHRFFRTSGSGGEEKWVALSEEALKWSAKLVVESLEISGDDVLGLALPEVHVGGYGVVLRSQVSGARLARFGRRWDVRRFTEWCVEEGVTVLSLVPTQVHDLVVGGYEGGSALRVVVVGGGALNKALSRKARELGWPVVPSYGMTETGSQVATGEGLPLLSGWEARVEEGCLALRGGGLLTAVIRREGRGFRAVDPKVDGWFLTQDRVELQGGCVRVLGRADRLVKVLGKLVDLESLEGFWQERLGRGAVIMAEGDERRGVKLVLVVEGEVERGSVALINASLPGPSRVWAWEQVTRFPRSPLGKIDRSALGGQGGRLTLQ